MKTQKNIVISAFIISLCLFCQVVAFSSQTPAPNSCYSGVYPVSNSISRGIQRVFGFNIITTAIAESIIKHQITKLIQKGNIKVQLKAYSAGDLIAGKLKAFNITGKNIVYNDIYLSSLKAESLCDFTYFDYKSNPPVLKSPLFVKYNGEITNDGFKKIFLADSIQDALQGIKINADNISFGEVDFTDIKPAINNGKININANLVYRRMPFVLKFPINFETALKSKDDKIFLTRFKFAPSAISNEFKFITNSIEFNNIEVFDLKTIEKDGAEINISKIKVVNDKISVEGTFWQPQTVNKQAIGNH